MKRIVDKIVRQCGIEIELAEKIVRITSAQDYSVQTLASKFTCSTDLVYRLIKSGQLKAYKLSAGKKADLRITPDAVEAYVQRMQVIT